MFCAISCSDNTPGYCKEDYLVGKCEECSKKRKHDDHVEESSATTLPLAASTSKSGKTKQTTLSSFFGKTVSTERIERSCEGMFQESNQSTTKKVNKNTNSNSSKKQRNLLTSTANNWKSTSLAKYMANDWLVINSNEEGSVTSVSCSVCSMYAEKIIGIKNFSHAWAFTGSINTQFSSAIDHARGEPHKVAMRFHLKEVGKTPEETAEIMATNPQQQSVTSVIANMQVQDYALTKLKFEVAYFVAKEEMPLSKCSQLLKLQEKHGVEIGFAYRSDMNCGTFIDFMCEELGLKLHQKLSTAHFYSFLIDSSEDVSVFEKAALFVQYLDVKPPGKDTVQVISSFMKLTDLKQGTAAGIVDSVHEGFRSIGSNSDEYLKKLSGFGADGATVNRERKEGVIAILQKDVPWLIYVWCVAHRLELSVKDSLEGSCFTEVDDMLLRLYYLYENSPKKLRQLRELYEIYKPSFEFEEGGVRPKRASGKTFNSDLQYATFFSLLPYTHPACYVCNHQMFYINLYICLSVSRNTLDNS